jgi:hypothetical protein
MEIIEKLETLLIPIEKIDFSIYSLRKSRNIFRSEKFHLKKLNPADLKSVNLDNIYWEYNLKTKLE